MGNPLGLGSIGWISIDAGAMAWLQQENGMGDRWDRVNSTLQKRPVFTGATAADFPIGRLVSIAGAQAVLTRGHSADQVGTSKRWNVFGMIVGTPLANDPNWPVASTTTIVVKINGIVDLTPGVSYDAGTTLPGAADSQAVYLDGTSSGSGDSPPGRHGQVQFTAPTNAKIIGSLIEIGATPKMMLRPKYYAAITDAA